MCFQPAPQAQGRPQTEFKTKATHDPAPIPLRASEAHAGNRKPENYQDRLPKTTSILSSECSCPLTCDSKGPGLLYSLEVRPRASQRCRPEQTGGAPGGTSPRSQSHVSPKADEARERLQNTLNQLERQYAGRPSWASLIPVLQMAPGAATRALVIIWVRRPQASLTRPPPLVLLS